MVWQWSLTLLALISTVVYWKITKKFAFIICILSLIRAVSMLFDFEERRHWNSDCILAGFSASNYSIAVLMCLNYIITNRVVLLIINILTIFTITTGISYLTTPQLSEKPFTLALILDIWSVQIKVKIYSALSCMLPIGGMMIMSNKEKYLILKSFCEKNETYKEQRNILNCLDIGIITQSKSALKYINQEGNKML